MNSQAFLDDVRGQPDNLVRAARVFLPALREADLHAFASSPLVLTGMGASSFAVVPAAAALGATGRGALALPASELLARDGMPHGHAMVGLSQSGRSAETVEAFRRADGPRLALTATGTGPLADAAELALPLGSDPDAGVSVLTYGASLYALAALASSLGAEKLDLQVEQLAELVDLHLRRSAALAEGWAVRLSEVRAVDAIGNGRAWASAGYAALLIREAARLPAASFGTGQYLHGPIEAVERGMAAIVFGEDREIRLAADLASFGAEVLLITSGRTHHPGVDVVSLPSVPTMLRPILEAIPVQLVAAELAASRGITPGSFRHHQAETKLEVR